MLSGGLIAETREDSFFFLLALHSPQPSERKTSSPGSPEECGQARELLGEMGWVLLPSL